MLFREEKLDKGLIAEIEELLVEQEQLEGCEFDVDWEMYMAMSKVLRIYTVRENKRLVGYASFIITSSPHRKNELVGIGDVIFILEEYRKDELGKEFIGFCGGRLAEENATSLTIAVKPMKDFSKSLLESGFELEQTTYLKRL